MEISINNNDGDVSNSTITKITLVNGTNIKLYPNPATNVLRVEGLSPLANTKLSIMDASGKLVQQINIVNQNYTYDIQKLAPGSYYLKIETDNKVSTLKFVKE